MVTIAIYTVDIFEKNIDQIYKLQATTAINIGINCIRRYKFTY